MTRKHSRGVTFYILISLLEDLKVLNDDRSYKDEYPIEVVKQFIRRHNLRQVPQDETK
jgi:hypothetical protein